MKLNFKLENGALNKKLKCKNGSNKSPLFPIMAFGPIIQQVQAPPQALPLPLPNEDEEYIEQRFQADYYTPEGEWRVITINWNTRQHRAIFSINQQSSFIEVERSFQLTLREVLALKNIVIHQMEMVDLQGQIIQDANPMLNQSVEDMPLLSATIWSHAQLELPIDQDFNQLPQLPAAAWEAAG